MFTTIVRNGSEQSYRYVRSVNGRETWTPRNSAPTFNPTTERTMVSKFDGTCKACGQKFPAGTDITWSKAAGAKHVTCPAPVVIEDDGNEAEVALANAEMSDDAADALLDEFEAINRRANLENTRKAIYRVSLHGAEGRYITDHVNIALVPSEKYGTVKIANYQGDSIGVIRKDGTIRLWDSVDPKSPHTVAVLAGLDILLGSADPIKFAQAFAVEAESCMRCGRPLVDDKSRARLLGPECASRW